MAFMKPHSFLVWWNSAQVTTDGMNVSSLVDGEERFTNLENPLLGTLDYPKKPKSFGKLAFILVALLAVTCFVLATIWSSSGQFELNGKVWTDAPDTVSSVKGVVTSDDERCSAVGVSMLNLGGHAVDAAIATALCLGVVSPTESGIGGGAFMVVRNASTSKAVAINMREVAPGKATQNMYDGNESAHEGGPLSVAVPGEIAGLYEVWKMYGHLPWKTLFQHAITYAKNGFEIYPYLANDIEEFEANITADPGLRQVFAPNGTILKRGDVCYNEKLGESLEALAERPHLLHHGWIGEKLVKDVSDAGGILSMEDLRNYKVKIMDVLEVDTILGFKMLGMPPPSSGPIGVILIANILSNYGSSYALDGPLGLHRLIEAIKHMFAVRTNLDDPAFVDISEVVSNMTSQDFAKEIWNKIDDSTTFPFEYYQSSGTLIKDAGTSHLSVVDKDRNAVALTTSVNDQFGSKMLSPSTGIVLNNQMKDFTISTKESPNPTTNLIEPGKTPLSSMSPIILVKDGQLAGVIGGSGGQNIIAAVTQVFLNHFVLEMDPRTAVHSPRVFPKLILNENDVDYENATMINGEHIELPAYKRTFLEVRNHQLKNLGFEPVCHLISQTFEKSTDLGRKIGRKSIGDVNFGTLTAVGDLRKDAKPAAQ